MLHLVLEEPSSSRSLLPPMARTRALLWWFLLLTSKELCIALVSPTRQGQRRLRGRLDTRWRRAQTLVSMSAPALVDSPAIPEGGFGTHGKVTAIDGKDEFLQILEAHRDEIVVVKFFATWCRACKAMAPRFEKIAADYVGRARFFSVEYDQNKQLCKEDLDLLALPTVQIHAVGHVDSFSCGASKIPIMQTKLGNFSAAVSPRTGKLDLAHPVFSAQNVKLIRDVWPPAQGGPPLREDEAPPPSASVASSPASPPSPAAEPAASEAAPSGAAGAPAASGGSDATAVGATDATDQLAAAASGWAVPPLSPTPFSAVGDTTRGLVVPISSAQSSDGASAASAASLEAARAEEEAFRSEEVTAATLVS